MFKKIHDWAAKSKLNMTLLLSLVAALGVAAHAYLPAAMADKVEAATRNVVVCGDLACTTANVVAIPAN